MNGLVSRLLPRLRQRHHGRCCRGRFFFAGNPRNHFLMNWGHGPWQSCAHWQNVSHAWHEWTSTADSTDDLSCDLYERLCFDHGQRQGLGSTDHFRQMFQTLVEDDNFGGAEEHLSLSRLLSRFRRWPALDRSWHKKLAAYSFYIVHSGNDLRNSLGGAAPSSRVVAAHTSSATAAASASSSSSVAPPLASIRAVKSGPSSDAPPCKDMSTLEKAAELLDDDGRQLCARALYSAALPCFRAHQATIREMKGCEVVSQKFIGFTSGSYKQTLRDTIQTLHDP